jgi:GntR family transcriptional regulator
VLLGYLMGCREKLARLDGTFCDLPEVEPADLGIERGLIIVIVQQLRHRHLLALESGTTTAYLSMLTLTRAGCRVSGHDAAVIDPKSATPVYVQLANLLRQGIQDGTYPPDRALPSIRTLQQTYEVADGTVQKALRILRDEGLAHTVQGRGVFVASRRPQDG